MKKMSFNARSFRLILIACLLIVLAASIGGFLFIKNNLSNYAEKTRELNSQAAASDDNIAAFERIKNYLANHKTEQQKAAQIVADSKQYRYQDDVIRDLTTYANESKVSIASFSFSSDQTTSGGTKPAPSVAGSVPAGVTPTTITVMMNSPLDYEALLRFIRRIEQNVTKMQIANVSFSRSFENGQSALSVSSLSIEVYLRK